MQGSATYWVDKAISHTSKDIRFDSSWSLPKKDAQIEKLRQYCKESAD